MARAVLAEATWDGDAPRLVDARKYRADAKAQKWPIGTRLMVRLSKPTRSERANAYYWGVVIDRIDRGNPDDGNSPEDYHDAFCERFIVTERKQVQFFNAMTGEEDIVEVDDRRSSALNGGDFYDFVEKVRIFAREFWNIDTPDPDPEYWRKPRDKRRAA